MILKKILCAIIILSVSTTMAFGALYSDMQLGVRSSAMGSSFVSVARDADAVYWNPAALALTKKSNVSFMYSDVYNEGINQSYLSYAQPLDALGLGASWLRHSADLEEGFGATKKTNSWVDDMYTLAAGIKAKKDLYAGLSVKRFKVKTDRTNADNVGTSGTGFDVSILMTNLVKNENSPITETSLGFMVRNLATDLSGENVDPSYKLGLSTKIYDDFLFAAGLDLDRDNEDLSDKIRVNLGAEYNYNNTLFLRLGLNDGDFTTGFGIVIKDRLSLDYAFEKGLGDFDKDNHRFSLGFWF